MKQQGLYIPSKNYSFFKVLSFIAFSIVVFFGLKEGIHGLRYFAEYPEEKKLTALLLLPHIGLGFIAILLGPLQFWKQLRTKYLHFHRWLGRIYISSVAISASIGLYMGITHHNLVFSTGTTGLAIAWLITVTMAFITIRKKLVQEHKEWMIRNYVVTFGFVSYRIGRQIMDTMDFEDTVIMAWLCWVPQLLITELLIQLSHSQLFNNKGKSDLRPKLNLTKEAFIYTKQEISS
ncbi:DUF2306 domain-containing protein [Catalinimonas sp. 4WD22]|uniref:DUF2306 domain-containing protein n=1 Tax=Catalinimonas locisalis TaxID=3133978 RepID=UPI0031014BFC